MKQWSINWWFSICHVWLPEAKSHSYPIVPSISSTKLVLLLVKPPFSPLSCPFLYYPHWIPIKSTLNLILHSLISSHHHLCWINPIIFPKFGNHSLARPLYIAPGEIRSTQTVDPTLEYTDFLRRWSNKSSGEPISNQWFRGSPMT